MTIRVLINGAHGKMGTMAVKALTQHPDFTVVGATGRNDNLATAIHESSAQIVVDLTLAEVVFKNTETIIHSGAHPIIGTSGLTKDEVITLQKRCAQLKLGGIIAPNFSIGAVLMMKHAQEIAKFFPHVEIIEKHHDKKLDSPSGTALRTAEMIGAARQLSSNKIENTRETIPGARGATYQDIPIHAIRLPGLLAQQEIIFGNLGETLTIQHNTIDRHCYIPGIILACQKVSGFKELIYGLENIL